MNLVMAFACALEPLAFSACLPLHSTTTEVAYDGATLSLAHPATTSEMAASKLIAAESLDEDRIVVSLRTVSGIRCDGMYLARPQGRGHVIDANGQFIDDPVEVARPAGTHRVGNRPMQAPAVRG